MHPEAPQPLYLLSQRQPLHYLGPEFSLLSIRVTSFINPSDKFYQHVHLLLLASGKAVKQ